MKKMNIGIMVLDLSGEYTLEFLSGVNKFFKDKDVNVIITQVKLPNLPYGFFEYQFWAGYNLLQSNSFDALIIVSSFFVSSIPVNIFSSWISDLAGKPIVSVGSDLNLPNVSYIKTECETAFRNLFNHLINKHGCKKIAFMSANKTVSGEAKERFSLYKQMLAEHGMEYDEELVYDGNFTTGSGETAMKVFTRKEEVPFDAIVCANDLMAVGVNNQLSRLGLSIPDDVIVAGFDNSIHARIIEPRLTTISQEITEQGYFAAELVYKKACGETVPKENYFTLKNVFRQSCGCIEKNDYNTDYISESGEKIGNEKPYLTSSLSEYMKNNDDKQKVYILLDVLQVSDTLVDLFYRFKQILFSVDIRRLAVVLYDEPIENAKGDDFILPKEVELALVLDREHDIESVYPGIRFNPREKIFPEDVFDLDYSEYVLEPIFFGEKQYGYFMLKMGETNYSQSHIYIKALANAIASSYEYTKKNDENALLSKMNEHLTVDNDKLNETSKTDELTQVFNRRGFMFAGKQILALTQSVIKSGTVFFCDMDGLKKINDNYGHHMGDAAIKVVAQALKKTFSLNDVIGRLGGDEFAVISGEVTLDKIEEKNKMISENCAALAKRKRLPFEVNVSVGAVAFTSNDTDLERLLKKADELQYKLKKEKKVARGDI